MVFRNGQPSEMISDFLKYLADCEHRNQERIPPLSVLSQQLGISTATLREQLEVARALGLVEVRPRTGIRRLPYTFRPAVLKSLAYSVRVDPESFKAYSDFRQHIEAAYWYQAVSLMTPEDHAYLRVLVNNAFEKLHGNPVQIPHYEHRELHLTIYRRLDNPFVLGALEAYWEMYEAVGMDVYTDLNYQERVWQYHQRMVDEISSGNFTAGYQALMEHMDLIFQRSKPFVSQNFE